MIKQIWFVKNVRKLINYLCLTIAFFILLYSVASVLGLVDLVWADIILKWELLVIPLVSIACAAFLYTLSNKVIKRISGEKPSLLKQLQRDLVIGTNLMLTLIFTFVSLDQISRAKAIEGFGLVPVYLVIIAGIIYYILRIKADLDDKKES